MIDIHKIKGYIGYGVYCVYKYKNTFGGSNNEEIKHFKLEKAIHNLFRYDYPNYTNIEYIKPILRSIEDLTLEKDWELIEWLCDEEFGQIMSLEQLKKELKEDAYSLKYKTYEKLYSEHIDIFDLIGQGLAIKKELKNG